MVADGEEVKDAYDEERNGDTVEDAAVADASRTHPDDEADEEEQCGDRVEEVPEVHDEHADLLACQSWFRRHYLKIKADKIMLTHTIIFLICNNSQAFSG